MLDESRAAVDSKIDSPPKASSSDVELNPLLEAGLLAGGISGGVWRAADDIYTRLPETVQNSNKYLQYFGNHLSPTSRELAWLATAREAAQTALNGATAQSAGTVERAAAFSSAEAAALTRHAPPPVLINKAHFTAAGTNIAASTNATISALDSARDGMLNPSSYVRGAGYAKAIGQGAGLGLATAGINIAADYLLSTATGEEPKLTGSSAWGLETLAVPFIMFNPKIGVASKIGLSGAAYAGSRIFGSLAGEPTGRFSAVGSPSWTEVGLSTVGAMLPLNDWRARAVAATVGWGLGKAYSIATSSNDRVPEIVRNPA